MLPYQVQDNKERYNFKRTIAVNFRISASLGPAAAAGAAALLRNIFIDICSVNLFRLAFIP